MSIDVIEVKRTIEPLLNPQEAALILNLSIRTLARLRAEGRGPRWTKISSRRIGYEPQSLRRWIEAGRAPGSEAEAE